MIKSQDFFSFLVPTEKPVLFSSVPGVLKKDFENFMYGKTVIKIDGEPACFPIDFNQWLFKLYTKGIGYDFKLDVSA